jgi:hypothetical protein
MTLRRRTSRLVAWLFLALLVASVPGAVYAAWKDPALAAFLTTDAFIGGAALATWLGEGPLTAVALGALLTLLALGACALALAGLPAPLAFACGALAVSLLVLLVTRAVIAAGSADYPYDT